MRSERLEAFTDGVVAIIITITVLEMRVPHGVTLLALKGTLPILIAYAISFANVGLYWNNHHHMLQATEHIDGSVLWANLFMLFWMSLVPWDIRWLDEAEFGALPTAAYGVVMGMTAVGYLWTQARIIAVNGRDSAVAHAVGRDRKGKVSLVLYAVAVPVALWEPYAADAIFVAIALWWFVPDRRIERELHRT